MNVYDGSYHQIKIIVSYNLDPTHLTIIDINEHTFTLSIDFNSILNRNVILASISQFMNK